MNSNENKDNKKKLLDNLIEIKRDENDIQSNSENSDFSFVIEEGKTEREKIKVEFFYLDMSSCQHCIETKQVIDEALFSVANVLKTSGLEAEFHSIHIANEADANQNELLTSPTIRINGEDIQPEFKETPCDACSNLCGCEDEEKIMCREWFYEDSAHPAPSKKMIVDAIMNKIFGNPEEQQKQVRPEYLDTPANLKQFFLKKSKKIKANKE